MRLSLLRRIRHCLLVSAGALSLILSTMGIAQAALQETINTSVDGFNGSIGSITEVAGAGTFDVQFINYQNSNWAFKRFFCGGEVSTYATAASGAMPNTQGETTTAFGLSVTLISSSSGSRTYRFATIPIGQPQNFCFVSGDGYRSTTLTSTAVATPTPVISNIRIINDAAIPGGRNICIDYTPNSYPFGVTSFDWIENGVATNGNANSLWSTYTCLNRSAALVEGQTYSLQLRFYGAPGSQTSNQLSITVPAALGDITNLSATNNDPSIPRQIRATWTAAPGATYYNVYLESLSTTTSTAALVSVSATTSLYVYVAACNSFGCRPWQSTPGRAAADPPTVCTGLQLSAQRVSSGIASVTATLTGVSSAATAATVTVNGTSFTASGSGTTRAASIPLTSGSLSSQFGSLNVQASATGPGGTAACPETTLFRQFPQDAQFIAHYVAGLPDPTALTLIAGRSYPANFSWRNTGQSTWSAATLHGIGTQSPQGNANFGTASFTMPTTVAPNQTVLFSTTTLTAPASPGSYTLQWRPYENNVEWFGQASTPINVTVVGAPTAATNVQASDGSFGDRVRVTWTPGANIGAQHLVRAATSTSWPSSSVNGLPSGWSIVCSGLGATATTCDDTTAVPGVTYAYRVFGWSSADGSQASGWDQGATSAADNGFIPAALTTAPQNFTASNNRETDIRLSWSPYAGATSFEWQRRYWGTDTWTAWVVNSPTATSSDDPSVLQGHLYCYRIRAINIVGPGPWSNESCGNRVGAPPPVLTVSQGTVTNATRLNWTSNTGFTPARQEVWRLLSTADLSNWTLLSHLGADASSYDDFTTEGADTGVSWYLVQQYDAANNATRWSTTATSAAGFSANVASGYANVAPSALAIPAINANSMVPGSSAIMTTDPNLSAGQPEVFVYSVSAQPASGHGTCAVQQSPARVTWTPPNNFAFQGTTSCTVSVVDRGGASISTVVVINVAAYSPAAPTGVAATDGTVNNAVRITWESVIGAASYRVLRNGAQIASAISSLDYLDITTVGATTYGYTVIAVSAAGADSPASAADTGYANVAPVATVFAATVPSLTATGIPAQTALTPSYSDPNGSSGLVLSAPGATSQGGTIAIDGARILYTAPATAPTAGSTTIDTFTFNVTDSGGLTAQAVATITVCGPPGLSAVASAQGGTSVDATVTRGVCNGPVNVRAEVRRDDGTLVSNPSSPTTPAPTTGPVQVPVDLTLAAPSRAGTYSGTLTATDALQQRAVYAYSHVVPCPPLQVANLSAELVGSKSPDLVAQTSATATDNCHLGAPVAASLGTSEPRVAGSTPSTPATVNTIGVNTVTWRFPVTAPGASQLRVTAGLTNESRYVDQLFPVSITCPSPSVLLLSLSPAHAQRKLSVQLAVAPCASTNVQTLTLSAAWLPASLSLSPVQGAALGLQQFVAMLDRPSVDGPAAATLRLTLSNGTTSTLPVSLSFDANSAQPLWQITAQGRPIAPNTPTTINSFGNVGLQPAPVSPVSVFE